MSIAYVFPGQGSQIVGMGKELYNTNIIAKKVYDEVDDALGYKLTDIIFNGPIEKLTLTKHVQPAIMATSIAMFRIAKLENPSFVAGHSLGEYTALCAMDSISLSDTAKLLKIRGESMQNACPEGKGAMAVILGLNIDKIKEITDSIEKNTGLICNIANDNDFTQTVISGEKKAINQAIELLKTAGAKRCMLLPLSVAPHSKLMEPTIEKMEKELNNISIKEPKAPLISNKTCMPMTNPNEIKEALLYQLVNGVRWRESIINMEKLGIKETIEIGPGSILSGLISRITKNINAKKLEI